MVAWLEHSGGGSGGKTDADRHAVAESLGERDHVRFDIGVLECKPLAGTAGAALYFVQHQQPLIGVADFAQPAQVIGMAEVDAGFTLDQLDQHRNNVAIVLGDLPDRAKVVERDAYKARYQGLEAGLYFAAAGCRQSGDGASVERVF